MPDDVNKTAQDSGNDANQDSKTTSSDKQDNQNKGPEDQTNESYVTPGTLKSLMAARDRKLKEQFDSFQGSQTEFNTSITSKIEALLPFQKDQDNNNDKGNEKKKQISPEYLDLKREHEQLLKSFGEEKKQVGDLKKRERDFRFETQVKDALNTNGCVKTEYAFQVIKDKLKLDESGNKVYAIVDTDGGEVELTAHQYVKDYVREQMLPEFFSGTHRPGSPASGDGNSSGNYEFTIEQLRDSEFYMANQEKIEKALNEGRVKLS